MKRRRILSVDIVLALVALALIGWQLWRAAMRRAAIPLPDPEIVAGFRMVAEQPPVGLRRRNVVTTSAGHFRAFTVCDPALCQGEGCCQERLFVEDLGQGRTYEIQGLPLTWRPFSDLAWFRGDVLTFERWAQPAYGVYYAVDVGEGELLLAAPLSGRSLDEQTDSRERER
jgi:hypothetical protein